MPVVMRKLRSALALLRGEDAWGQLRRRAGENLRGVRLGLHGARPLVYRHASGFPYVVVPEAPETREMYLRGQGSYERVESEVMRRWLSPGDAALDCGANVGLITALMAERIGPTGRVTALEPSPSTAAKLEVVVAALGLSQVTIRRLAVSEAPGAVFFSDDAARSEANAIRRAAEHEGRTCVRAEAVTLEALLAGGPAPALIKMDIEGAEPLAFRGWPALARVPDPPLFVFEVYPRGLARLGLTPADLFRAMPLERYRLWRSNASWPNAWPHWPRGVPFALPDPFQPEWPMHSNVIAVPREGAFAPRGLRLQRLLPAHPT